MRLRRPAPIFGRYYDLDAHELEYVLGFPGIIKRRSPDASRPPAPFRMVYANSHYEVWRRQGDDAVVAHLPLQRPLDPTARPRCRDVRRLAARAGSGRRIVAAWRPELVSMEPTEAADRPPGWIDGPTPKSVTPTSTGEASGVRKTGRGRFRAWMFGSFGRPTGGYVDGRLVGAADDINGPGQWLELGATRMRPGSHELRLRRPGPSLGPGNAVRGVLGPLALEPVEAPRLVRVRPNEAARLCGREWDWIELVE